MDDFTFYTLNLKPVNCSTFDNADVNHVSVVSALLNNWNPNLGLGDLTSKFYGSFDNTEVFFKIVLDSNQQYFALGNIPANIRVGSSVIDIGRQFPLSIYELSKVVNNWTGLKDTLIKMSLLGSGFNSKIRFRSSKEEYHLNDLRYVRFMKSWNEYTTCDNKVIVLDINGNFKLFERADISGFRRARLEGSQMPIGRSSIAFVKTSFNPRHIVLCHRRRF